LPVSWDDHFSGAGYTIDKTWMDRVEEITNYALDNGMYVIINIHHNNWIAPSLANEANAKDHLVKLWPQIAERFKKYDHHLIFETMNEPRVAINGVDDWSGKQEYFDVVNRLNAAALEVIRATGGNNAKRLVMLPGYVAGSSDLQLNGIVLPKDKMIALSTHAYSPYSFALDQKGTDKFTDTKTLDDMYNSINSKFILKGIPVIMGEWASTNKGNLSERIKHAEYFVKGAKKIGIPTVWWDNGNFSLPTDPNAGDIMAILDRKTNTWPFQTLVDAIMRGAK
jgi:endoglucanase